MRIPRPSGIPRIESHLPWLTAWVEYPHREYEAGTLDSWAVMTAQVQSFFTPARMDQVEALAPGWRAMCSRDGGATLTHVIAVLTALRLSPEYRRATADQQSLMEWIVLFHDITKQAEPGRRDSVHGFRSAASAARALPALGFAVTADYPRVIGDWTRLSNSAVTRPHGQIAEVQDNRKLPEITAGIDRMFDRDSPAALVVQGVLLHMSITVVQDWPQAAPMTDTEIDRYVSRKLLPLLRAMMLADNDAWALFDPPAKERYRRETLAAFDVIRQRLTPGNSRQ